LLKVRHPDVGDLVEFLAASGWRRAEALGLTWAEVRWEQGVVIVPASRTKTRDAHIVPIAGRLRSVLERRRGLGACPWVFHRSGRPIRYFRRSWRTATAAAGLEGLRVHGLRRSIARNHRKAGIPEPVTMAIAGWKDLRSLRRYGTVDEAEMAAALVRAWV
jgi:integrase